MSVPSLLMLSGEENQTDIRSFKVLLAAQPTSADMIMVVRGSAPPVSNEPVLLTIYSPVCRSVHTEPRPQASIS